MLLEAWTSPASIEPSNRGRRSRVALIYATSFTPKARHIGAFDHLPVGTHLSNCFV